MIYYIPIVIYNILLVFHVEMLDFVNNILTNGFVPSLYLDRKEILEIVQCYKDKHLYDNDETTTYVF